MRSTCCSLLIFFFKQKTAYEMRISDWSSDVCSSDLSIRLIGDYTHRDESCCGAPYIETRERRPVAGGGYSTAPFNRIAAILAGQGSVFGADPYDRDLTITAGRNYVSKDRKSTRLNSSH